MNLSPPPSTEPFDVDNSPNRAWIEWMQANYRSARSNQGTNTTALRPTNGMNAGDIFWDSSLQKPIWWTGAAWKDATGAIV